MEPEPDISPRQIGGFRVLRRLASGATTDVLLARAEGPHGFERVVALKVLLQQFRSDPAFERMFAREASAYARLSHPAIVKLYDFFAAEGQLVMVLEFVDGLPLHRLRAMLSIGGERLEDSAALFIGSRIFAALAAAHSARDPENGEFSPVIHRDINPSNVLVPWDGHVKIADFGIAKIGTATGDTRLGFVKGTYGYMAPEQVRGETVTVRADVYAATLVLWELLARRKAIQRGALPEVEVLKAMAKPEFPTLDTLRGDLHAEVREVVRRGLEPNPDRRAITAEEMASVLRRMIKGDEGRASLSAAIARVRPAPASEGLAVTMARPTSPSFSELMNPTEDDGDGPPSRPASSRDPDATQPFNTADLPEDSGAFKRFEMPMTMGKGMRPEELEDLVSGDGTVDDPRAQGDLTLVEARRPGATDPPPTTEQSPRPPNSAPSTLPLPASLPVPDPRASLLGVVRNDLGKTHPDTLRFGPASASPPRPAPPKTTPAQSPPAPSGGPPSSRPVPRPLSTRSVSSGPSSPAPPGVAPAGKPPSVPKPIASKPAPPAAVPSPPKAEASPAPPPVSTRERTLVSAPSPSVSVPVPVPAPQVFPRQVPTGAVEVSPTLISPSGPPAPAMPALARGSSPVSAVKPATTTLLVGGATTSLEPPAAPPSIAVEPDVPGAPPVEPKLPLPLADAGSSSGALPVPQNPRVLPTMKLARSVPPPRSRRRRTGLWAMFGVALGSALVGIAGVEVYFRSYEPTPHASASGPSKNGPIDKASASSATPPTPPPPAASATATATSTAPAAPSASPATSAAASPTSVVDAAAPTAASAPPSASPAGTDPDAAAAWMGDIFTDAPATGHRVFVDGKVVGETPGPIQVRCGKRNVQVGSAGASRDVNVPCGGSVQVTP